MTIAGKMLAKLAPVTWDLDLNMCPIQALEVASRHFSPFRRNCTRRMARCNISHFWSSIDLPSQGEDTGGHGLFNLDSCALAQSPSMLDTGRTQPQGQNEGDNELGTIVVQKRLSRPKGDHSKNCISGFQAEWASGVCMEATQSLKSLYQQGFWFETQDMHSEHFDPWTTLKVGKRARMPILGHIYPSGTKGHIVCHMAKWKDP